MNWTATIERYLAEGRTVSGGKDDGILAAQERQMQVFSKQLQQIFSTQFAKQSGVLNFLQNKLTDQVNNPTGLSPTAMAASRTGVTEAAANSFANAQKATQAVEAARGGSTLPSGVDAQIAGENANAAAAANTTGQTAVTLTDQQLKQQNYWNAVNGLSSVASAESPLPFGEEAIGSSGGVGSLGGVIQGGQSQLQSSLGGAAAGIGAAL